MQTSLFAGIGGYGRDSVRNGFRDPAFTRNKDLPLHRWVPWVAGFSAQFVEDCLAKYLTGQRRSNACVLDPFAGVGTTLVEAFTQGIDVVGFEINPYAALAARLKLQAAHIAPERLSEKIRAFQEFMDDQSSANGRSPKLPASAPPPGFAGRTTFFSPTVERKILFTLDFINCIEDDPIRDLFRLALGSLMVGVSNYSYEPSLTRRSAVNKPDIQDAPVAEVLTAKLRMMEEDLVWLQARLREGGRIPSSKVINGSIFRALEILERKRVANLVVTSPPYLNNYHYPRNTRPQLHWLGFASGPGYKSAGEDHSFGKFWQTVRDLPAVHLSFRLPPLEKTIEAIRCINVDRGPYGGPGWANYVATYFNDAHRFNKVLARLLKIGAVAVVVLGNSIIQGVEVKTEQLFGEIAQLCGLRLEEILLLREKRTGTSIIHSSVRVEKAAVNTALYESAIVLRRVD